MKNISKRRDVIITKCQNHKKRERIPWQLRMQHNSQHPIIWTCIYRRTVYIYDILSNFFTGEAAKNTRRKGARTMNWLELVKWKLLLFFNGRTKQEFTSMLNTFGVNKQPQNLNNFKPTNWSQFQEVGRMT
jgi:hypothetical protein